MNMHVHLARDGTIEIAIFLCVLYLLFVSGDRPGENSL